VFPDACCVFAHREPGEFMASILAIVASVYDGINAGAVSRRMLGQHLMGDFKQAIGALAVDPVLDDPRISHVRFADFVREPVAAMRACYGHWGFEFTAAAEAGMRAWLADAQNSSDRYGRGNYAFEPFGVDWQAESPAFDSYRARFLR
ncbi:MAG TPA: sulfotransferase, partial [Novosphingobium sp.]